MKTILILIPALDEKFIEQTVDSAIDNSSGDYQIRFGILEQSLTGNFSNLQSSDDIEIIKVHTPKPRGVGWARSTLCGLIKDEDYTLVIDGHTLFTPNWDYELVTRFEKISEDLGPKSVVTQCLHWALIEEDHLIIDPWTSAMPPWKLKIDGLVAKAENFDKYKDYEVHYSLSCHFMFSYSKNFLDVPFDKDIFFISEEPILGLRYCTRGYNLVAINYNPMYHLSKYSVRPEGDWKMYFDIEKTIDDAIMLIDVLTGRYIGERGSPDIESLEKFKKDSGISLSVIMDKLGARNENELSQIIRTLLRTSFEDNDTWTALYETLYNLTCKEPLT